MKSGLRIETYANITLAIGLISVSIYFYNRTNTNESKIKELDSTLARVLNALQQMTGKINSIPGITSDVERNKSTAIGIDLELHTLRSEVMYLESLISDLYKTIEKNEILIYKSKQTKKLKKNKKRYGKRNTPRVSTQSRIQPPSSTRATWNGDDDEQVARALSMLNNHSNRIS